MTVLAVAHRAGNSLTALRAAVEAGAHVLEADVHAHRGRLEVRHLKALGPLPFLWDRSGAGPLPSPRDRWELVRHTPQLQLEELLDAARAGATLMLDLKGVGGVGPSVARLLHERVPDAPIVVCGRWWPSVQAFDGAPWARQVLSARGRAELARLRRRLRTGPPLYGVSVHRSLLEPRVVQELRRQVEVVMTWPVNDDDALERVLAAGVNGVITDEVDVLRSVVASA
ncbi:MAG TPA: glycerophosphodiester phosphodiesterase [Mycobacteriales bacterium]|nr:glycerophosphodiester phosphodiesterase [Mycobacteriales bacterium]